MVYSPTVSTNISGYVSRFFKQIDAGLILAGLLTLLIIQSLARPGLPAAADIPIHLYRTIEYGRAWGPGVIVPRWSPNLAYGYGYPLFVFSPPLPHWLGLAFHIGPLSYATALKALIMLTIPLYATGMYLLARDLLKTVEAGLVAAVAYAFAVATEIHLRLSFSIQSIFACNCPLRFGGDPENQGLSLQNSSAHLPVPKNASVQFSCIENSVVS